MHQLEVDESNFNSNTPLINGKREWKNTCALKKRMREKKKKKEEYKEKQK